MQITPDGQIPIPDEFRQQLGLLPGTEVELQIVGNTLHVTKKIDNRGQRLIALMQGKATTLLKTDEIIALTRSES